MIHPVEGFRRVKKNRTKYIQLFVFYFTSVSISSPCRKDQFAVFTYTISNFTLTTFKLEYVPCRTS